MPSGNLETFGVHQAPVEPKPEVKPEVKATETTEEGEAPEAPTGRIARVRGSLHDTSAPGDTAVGVQRQMDELKGNLEGRLDAVREDLRNLGKSDEGVEAPAAAGINFDNESVGQAFRDVYDDEDPKAFGRAVGEVVRLGVDEVRKEMTTRLDEIEANSTAAQKTVETSKDFASNMTAVIPRIRSMGESEGAVLDDYLERGDDSFLGQYFQKYPTLTQDAEGIVGAALAVARMVDIADARITSTEADDGTPAGPDDPAEETQRSVRTEAAPSRGSNRSVQRIKDDAEGKGEGDLTPAEALRKSIVEAGSPGRGMPRVFH